jgi:predicted DNA-binding transcriptional regulator AlpA
MMLTQADLDAIADVVARHSDEDLWSREDIAKFTKLSERSVRTMTSLPSFPKAVRLPGASEQGHPRYYKHEVREWVRKHREED